MPALQTWQARTFLAGSTVALAKVGGAVLGKIWISTKGTSPTIVVYDNSASLATKVLVPSTVLTAIGSQDVGPVEGGTGLCVKALSCTGTIYWRPSQAG